MATRKKKAVTKPAAPKREARYYYWIGDDSVRDAVDDQFKASVQEVIKECRENDDSGVEDGANIYIYKVEVIRYKVNKPVTYEEVK